MKQVDERGRLVAELLCERYEILGLLGKGGFASVYKVKNRNLERLEALKVLDERARPSPPSCSDSPRTLVVPTEVADEAQCKALVKKTVAAFGRLDMLINNAGLAASALFDEFPDLSLFRHVMDDNFYGAVYRSYHALPYLKQTKGRIVAISSLGGKVAIPYNTPYCAIKYGLNGFYHSLRMELTRHGVGVTAICPGLVVTEFHAAQVNRVGVSRGAARARTTTRARR